MAQGQSTASFWNAQHLKKDKFSKSLISDIVDPDIWSNIGSSEDREIRSSEQ